MGGESRRRPNVVAVRLDNTELAAVERAARHAGMTRPAYVRQQLLARPCDAEPTEGKGA
jgi:hypothetical protein